jgi:hypothetical protein
MNAAHDWHDLAIGVMQVGYQTDLGYFYLGRAAQGLGADQAAIRYYEIAAAISQGSNPGLKCKGVFDTCDGIAMPYILVTLIQQSQADLQKRQAEAAAVEEANTENTAVKRKHHVRKPATKPPAIQQPSDIPLVEPPPVTR